MSTLTPMYSRGLIDEQNVWRNARYLGFNTRFFDAFDEVDYLAGHWDNLPRYTTRDVYWVQCRTLEEDEPIPYSSPEPYTSTDEVVEMMIRRRDEIIQEENEGIISNYEISSYVDEESESDNYLMSE